MKRFLVLANATIVAGFAVLHLAGARACVGFLSGTAPASDLDLMTGVGYALAWFGVVLWVPITTLALILDRACGRLVPWRRSQAR
jgi:hypothetical protein